jgi:hypothetical protein
MLEKLAAQADDVMNAWTDAASKANELVRGGLWMSPALREDHRLRSVALMDRVLRHQAMERTLLDEEAALNREEELLDARIKAMNAADAADGVGLLSLTELSGDISE